MGNYPRKYKISSNCFLFCDKMNKIYTVAGVTIVCILVGAVFADIILPDGLLTYILGDGEYHTGFTIDTRTKSFNPIPGVEGNKQSKSSEPYALTGYRTFITSWYDGNEYKGLSEMIAVHGSILMYDPGNCKRPFILAMDSNGNGQQALAYTVDICERGDNEYVNIIDGTAGDNPATKWKVEGTGGFNSDYVSFDGVTYGWDKMRTSIGSGVVDGNFGASTGMAFRLKGPHVGKLRLRFWVYGGYMEGYMCRWTDWINPGSWVSFFADIISHADKSRAVGWHCLAEQEVYIISGSGHLYISDQWGSPSTQTLYEIGETVYIHVETGYGGMTAHDTSVNGGSNVGEHTWFIKFRHPDGYIRDQYTISLNDDYSGLRSWVVPEDAFAPNKFTWKIELWNTLFCEEGVEIDTIDVKANAPGTPVVHASPDDPEAGETVTIDIYATINPNTQADIDHFTWWAHYGTQIPIRADDPDWVVYKRNVSAVETSSNHFEPSSPPSFEAPGRAGTITIGVLAVDADGRPSQRGYDTVTVYAGNFRIVVTVVDMNTNEPIPFAVVQVGQPYQYTNQVGVAEVFVGGTGTYTLHVWKSGYEDAYPSVEVSGSTTYITVPLKYVGGGGGPGEVDQTLIYALLGISAIFVGLGAVWMYDSRRRR